MALRVGKDPFDYINEIKVGKSRQSMKRRLQEYHPNSSSIDTLERVDEKHHLIVFSADWCSDCIAYIPGLAKSLIMAKNNMLQARVVDYDAYRDMAEEFHIRALPTIIVYDKNWKEIGRFVETPKNSAQSKKRSAQLLDQRARPRSSHVQNVI